MSVRARVRRILVAVVLAASAVACAQSGPQPAAPLAGTDLEGQPLGLEHFDGDVVVVTMWASWCGPCRDEVPVLNSALDRWKDDGLAVLGVNFRDIPEAATQFVDTEGARFPSIADPDGSLGVSWGVRALPQSFVVDRDGTIATRLAGPVTDQWIESDVVPVVTAAETS